MNLRGLRRKLERLEGRRQKPKLSPWDVLFATPGEMDPDDPDVRAALTWWDELLASVPNEPPDLIEERLAQPIAPASDPSTNGRVSSRSSQEIPLSTGVPT